MAFEIELKYRVPDTARLAEALEGLGARQEADQTQTDLYLAHPDRDFARTDEVLRIRQIGTDNVLTYKGPKQPGPTKTRREIEIPFAAGAETRRDLLEMLQSLGFSPVLEIRKQRATFSMAHVDENLTVTIDWVDGIGTFAEVETLVVNESSLSSAQQAVVDLARRLGLTEVEPRSYLGLVLESLSRNPGGPT